MATMTSPARQATAISALLRRRITWWHGVVSVLVVLAVWQFASMAGLLPATSLPSALSVFAEWGALLVTGTYWAAVGETISSAMLGLLIAVAIGLVVGVVVGSFRFIRESTWFIIEFLKPIPPVAMIPLALLLWGPSSTMKLTLITYGALWPFLIQVIYGVSQVDSSLIRMSRSYRLGAWLTSTRVVFPAMLPFAATGLRVSASVAIIVSVVTELVGGAAGLGRNIILAGSANNLPEVYALILTTGMLGVVVNMAFASGEKPLLFWHASQRGEGTS